MPPRPATSVLTDEDSRARLDAQLAADEEHVLDALSRLEPASPLCCLGLAYVADDELASVSYIYAWTVAAREAAFAADPKEALWDLSRAGPASTRWTTSRGSG